MMRFLRGILFVFLVVPGVQAQTLKHEFQRDGEAYTVYLHIREGWIETWRVGDDGECMMYPSSVTYENDTIRFSAGTEWSVEKIDRAMRITFPGGRTVLYERTQRDPAAICGVKGKSG